MKKTKIFVVDDDPIFLKAIEQFLLNNITNVEVTTFSTGEACLHEMHRHPDIIILDYYLNSEFPDAWNGIEILKKLNLRHPEVFVVILSAQKNVDIAITSISEGAFEYVEKNNNTFPTIKSIIQTLKEEEKVGKRTTPFTFIAIIVMIILLTFLIVGTKQ